MPSGEADPPILVIDRIVATATPLVVQNCAVHPLFKEWKRLGNGVGPNSVETFIGVPIRIDSKGRRHARHGKGVGCRRKFASTRTCGS